MEPAGVAHAAALAAIHAEAFPPDERWVEAAFAAQIGLRGVFGWIDTAGGMILARVAADEAEVLTLGVVPAARRGGVARALLARAMAEAAGRGAASMVLEVADGNAPAAALYRGAGFRAVGRRRGYYGGAVDAVIMRAVLDPCGSGSS